MLKRLYLANGTLQVALSKTADDISVDAGLATYMLSVLGIGDWAYLTLRWLDNIEVIKVYLNYSGLGVLRGQDGTCQQAFPIGTQVIYSVTQIEIQDATPATSVNIYANGAEALTVSGSGYTWSINYADVYTQCYGGIQAYYSTSDATLHLADYFPAAGCLTAAGNGAPLIGGPYFYLTSQLYPVDCTESAVAADPNSRKGKPGGFGPGPMWTLTQPFVIDGTMRGYATGLSSLNTFGSQGSINITDSAMKLSSTGFISLLTWGTEGGFTLVDSSAMKGNTYILQMLLFGSGVSYSYGVDKYVYAAKMAINSLVVS